jgi:hypothetical protein
MQPSPRNPDCAPEAAGGYLTVGDKFMDHRLREAEKPCRFHWSSKTSAHSGIRGHSAVVRYVLINHSYIFNLGVTLVYSVIP